MTINENATRRDDIAICPVNTYKYKTMPFLLDKIFQVAEDCTNKKVQVYKHAVHSI